MTSEHVERAATLLARGDLNGARSAAEAGLRAEPGSGPLRRLLGLACCRSGDLAAGSAHLRRALEIDAGDREARTALAHALAMTGAADEALSMCSPGDASLARLRAWLLQERGQAEAAAEAYEAVVAGDPDDWEAWNNLGNARRASGDAAGAVEALHRAARLRPGAGPVQSNLGSALAEAGRFGEALDAFAQAARLEPQNPAAQLAFGAMLRRVGRAAEALPVLARAAAAPLMVEAELERARALAALRRLDDAEAAYRRAIAAAPAAPEGWMELGTILERGNRLEALDALLKDAAAAGTGEGELSYLKALSLARRGETERALAAARASPVTVEPARRAALIGRLADRLGDTATAFAAYGDMNRLMAADFAAPGPDPEGYRDRIRKRTALVSRAWYGSWSADATAADRPAPAFLIGFPRSGTTLLDTLLMGHPQVAVLEEEPALQRVEERLGDWRRLPSLSPAEMAELRSTYFATADALGASPERLIVDKLPLNVLGTPIIHRLFPDARLIFAERHPCDAVLSGFMQDFELNDAMASFLTLDGGAALYDAVLSFWTRCREVLPLRVRPVRYERLVEDPEAELRPLVAFLGLEWDDRLLDHRRTARERGTILTPSYRQVTQPVYRSAAGRWERYRREMAPVLPVLAPWAERLGYPPIGLDP